MPSINMPLWWMKSTKLLESIKTHYMQVRIIPFPVDPDSYTMEIEGTYNNTCTGYLDDGKIYMSFNLAPTEVEDNSEAKEVIQALENEIKYQSLALMVIKSLMEMAPIELAHNFYWNEGDLLLEMVIPVNHPAVQLKLVTITKGLKLKYRGFGSNVGEIYEVVASNEKVTRLKGKVFGRLTDFGISTKDLLETINVTKDYIVVPNEPK